MIKRFYFTLLASVVTAITMATAPKIYINPGHGGYNSNDRNIVTIPFAAGDTSGFWESRANLTKGLYLRDLLQEAGAIVYMSRTDNRSGYRDNTSIATSIGDRPLSTIAREASNKADFMLSIHSNAGNSSTSSVNYLLLMLTGTSGSGEGASSFKSAEALAAARACWPYLIGNELTEWSHYTSSTNIKSYTTTTVISPSYLTIPGFLSEGEFHDYHPETHRLLNKDYCKLEAYRFYQFFQAYYSLTKRSTGVVCGDVRDSIAITNSLYKPVRTGTKDVYTPLNGATVKLYTAGGTLVDTYVTDNYYNGIYAFFDVAPGSYKLEFSANGHQSLVRNITVAASEITTEEVFLSEGSGGEIINPTEPLSEFYEKKIAESPTSWLDNHTIVRAIVNGNKIYALTSDSRIVVVNALTGDSITQLSTTGISGSVKNVSDIAFTSDGYLVGCTMEQTAYTPSNYWRVYKWANDDATPTLLFESHNASTAGNYTNAITGQTFCFSGTSTNFKVYSLAETTGGTTKSRIVLYNGSTIYNRDDNVQIIISTVGEDARLTMSPFNENQVFLDSKTIYPTPYNCTWTNATNFSAGSTFALTDIALAGGTFCRYGDYILYITPTMGEKLGVAIYDVTSGMNTATLVNTLYPEANLQLANVKYATAAAEVYGEKDLLVTLFAQGVGAVRWQLATSEFVEEQNTEAPTLVEGSAPKREMRSAWISTAWCLDWPSSGSRAATTAAATTQKAELVTILDRLKSAKMNAVNFQVRPMADAFYNSAYEPWSVYLTGTRGAAPKYDPLEYAIDEAHARGMELHAWLNPYRYSSSAGTYSTTLNGDVAKNHADWIMDYGSGKTILNPGIPDVRTYIAKLIVDIITKYDVDGIVFDDYFYQSGTTDAMDAQQFANYNPNHLSLADWRRENVNKMVAEVNDSIKKHKPWVRFGIAPAGVAASSDAVANKYSVNKCPKGSDWQYNDIFSEPVQWLQNQDIDYISPQVYWKIGHSTNDYTQIASWWYYVAEHFGRHAFISHDVTAVQGASNTAEMADEIAVNRTATSNNAAGSIIFRAAQITDAFASKIATANTEQALPPAMTWYATATLAAPTNLSLSNKTLSWQHTSAERFSVYAYPKGGDKTQASSSSAYLLGITYSKSYDLSAIANLSDMTLAVCALDRYGNEYEAALYNEGAASQVAGMEGANIYASELTMSKSNDAYTFSCLLNENATDVEVQLLYEGEVVCSKSFGEQTKGAHSFIINESEIVWPDYQSTDHMNWAIKATARPINAISKLTDDSTPYQLFASYGVAVDCNPENSTFGHIYATNSKSGTCAAGRTTAQGIFAWKSDLSQINSTAYAGGVSWGADNSPFRLNVAQDGRLFICDFKDAHSGIWIADGANMSNNFTQLFQHNTKLSNGIAKAANGDTIHGSISGCYPLGSGNNLQLFTMDEDYLVSGKVGNMLRYDLGTATSWDKRPSAVAYNNGVNKFIVNTTLNLAPDGLGGWWVIQYRYAETIAEPALMHVDINGTVDFSSGGEQLIDNSRNGGIAVSADFKRLATTNANSIKVWDINYGEDGAVEGISLKYTIDESTISGLGAKSNDLAFDPAGNLYYVSSTTELLIGIGLPKTNNSYTTTAPSTQKIMLPTYSVTFKDFDNTQIVVRNVPHGAAAVAPTEPTRVGYTFAGWDADFSHIYNDTIIRATYTANSGVAYQVKHLQQNIVGTEYVLFEIENKNGTTGESVTPDVKSYSGFTAPATQTVTIAADGSTVVEYCYVRKSYTLTWNADGGNLSGAYTSGSVKFGATITVPTATKEGYSFSSWSPNAPATMPANDVTITAIWSAGTNTAYRVLHYQQNLANNDFTLFETENKNGTTGANVTPERKSYTGFTAPASQTVTINANGTTEVIYNYTRNSYTLTWNAAGGNLSGEYTSGSVRFGASLVEPSIAKVGYEFSGWDTNVPNTMPATNCTFTATWAAANDTKYTVNHLRQNIEGTQYEQFETETKYGTTDTEVTPSVKTYEGFASPSAQTITIAADGSSVINYQYDRDTYRVRFFIDEHTADSSDLKFGTAIVAPTPAIHEGYTFGGWDADVPATVPAHNLTFTAVWLSGDNTAYKVVHRQQNIADNNYTVFETEYLAGTTDASVTPAVRNYEGFTAPNTQTATILGDGSLVIIYDYTRNKYTLKWVANNGTWGEGDHTTKTVKYGTVITPPTCTRQGYIFNGWNVICPATMPASDLTLTAQWAPSTNTPYTVYHYLQNLDGTYPTEPSETQVFYGTTNESVKVYSKEYAGFKATSSSATVKITPQGGASHDFNYKRQSYALSWNANGGELTGDYTSGSVLYETPITAPQATRVGYTFASWSTDVPSSMPSEALTLTAQWTPNTNTTYFAKHYLQNVDGTTPSKPYETITFYGTTAQTVSVATKDYEGFVTPAVTNVTIAADGTSMVEYVHTRQSYTLTWDAGEGGKQQRTLLFGENIIAPNAPTLTRYNFLGWGNIAATMPAHDVTYSAQWELKTFVVIFNDLNGSQLKRETVEYGATVVAPEAPDILGYTFKNWDKDFSEITENLTIVPVYEINKYTVTFVTYNNEVKQQVEYGHDAVPPTDCERVGYELNGWLGNYTNVTADVTIYANWKPRNDTRYTVYHYQQNANDNGYTLVDTDLLQGTSDAVVTAALKSYTGFIAPEQEQIEIVADGSAEKSYYYDRQTFNVRFMVDDVAYDEQSVRYESNAIAPEAPVKEGYTFVQWDKAFDNVTADMVVSAIFQQNTATDVVGVEFVSEIYGKRGAIYVATNQTTTISIYTATGQLVHQSAASQLTFRCVPGIYLVDLNGRTTKVVVR